MKNGNAIAIYDIAAKHLQTAQVYVWTVCKSLAGDRIGLHFCCTAYVAIWHLATVRSADAIGAKADI